jgi:hypothetical protein
MAMTEKTLRQLYAVSDMLDKDVKEELGLYFPLTIYLQDPLVAQQNPKLGFSELKVKWEPGIADGPTSARFAVVDYNSDTGTLVPPAKWDAATRQFTHEGQPLDKTRVAEFQFHQVNVWAHLQNALQFFEEGSGMGRRIPWGFDENRLIIVPHAGYGQNAFYDNQSKSLQFYYFEFEGQQVYTCLSTDIINHEFGHAVLDGVRPHFTETPSTQTAAFHEFMGDITAILLLLRNSAFRDQLAAANKRNLSDTNELKFLAEEFGRAVQGKEYLRSARNDETMDSIKTATDPHFASQVLTGAMYDILIAFSEHYMTEKDEKRGKRESPKGAFWRSIQRMQRVTFQPLDLLPPVDVTFRDYAMAVLRSEELSNPTDPNGYRKMMIDVFRKRGILSKEEAATLNQSHRLYDRFDVDIFHSIEAITRSRASAYRFLDDNRRVLFIPPHQDFSVTDLYEVNKYSEVAHRLPRQYVLEFIWYEDVLLDGREFGDLQGRLVAMPCGGTLVFDERGNILSWFQKHGSHLDPDQETKPAAKQAARAGKQRVAQFKADIAHQLQLGQFGIDQASRLGILGTRMAPFLTRMVNGTVRFELAAHINLNDEGRTGDRSWQISS